MCRSDRKSHRRIYAGAIALLLTGCAGAPGAQPPPNADGCAADRTLVCAYRFGKPYKCACQSKDSLEEIFDISKH